MMPSIPAPEYLEFLWSVGAALPGREVCERNELYRQVVRETLQERAPVRWVRAAQKEKPRRVRPGLFFAVQHSRT
jgi:hypothetical protein